MSSRKRARKAQQQRLTFEPVSTAASSSSPLPGLGLSPARVRLASPRTGQQESPSRRSVATSSPLTMAGRKRKPRQQTLESSIGRSQVNKPRMKSQPEEEDEDSDDAPLLPLSFSSKRASETRRPQAVPPSPRSSAPHSSMFGSHTAGTRRRMVVLDSDSESPAEEVGGIADDSDGEGPLRHETSRPGRQMQVSLAGPSRMTSSSGEDEDSENEAQGNVRSVPSLPDQAAADDDEDDGLPVRTPRSSMPLWGRKVIDENEDDEEDSIQTPAKRRRLNRQKAAPAESDSEGEGVLGTPKSMDKSKGKRIMRSGARKHRSTRDKKKELLRRRKAGERHLTIEDLDTSEDERGLYDTDSENEALSVFDDDEESEAEQPAVATDAQRSAKEKTQREAWNKTAIENKRDREASGLDDDEDEADDDFIDDDDRLGVPDEALSMMPLEFTRSAIKPLKEHFKDAVAWLVHRRINPSFDQNSEVYTRAWLKLSDEVTGLAQSKFISTVWRPDFHKALKARPYIDQKELGSASLANEFESCQACGRSGHPATWSIRPFGKPYDPNTLDEVESDSEDEEEQGEEDEDEDEKEDRDFKGNPIPPETKEFYVGQTCNSNAETAHSLMHWKVALRDYVEGQLEGEGHFVPEEVLGREQMRPKARKRLAEGIVARWDELGTIKGLFGDFQTVVEAARNKDPTKVSRSRRY